MDSSPLPDHLPSGGPGTPNEEALRCETLNVFRSQLHQLSRHKDQLMPKPDGSFPGDWLRLAWEYQSLAEQMMRSQRWPGNYPEGLLACVNEQVKYLRRRLGNFTTIPDDDKKDKFRRVYVLAALGIIAKLKLVTFCWTFVELKRGEQYAAYASSQGVGGVHGGSGGLGRGAGMSGALTEPDLNSFQYPPSHIASAFAPHHGPGGGAFGQDGSPVKQAPRPQQPGMAGGCPEAALLEGMQGAGPAGLLMGGGPGGPGMLLQGGAGPAGLGLGGPGGPLGLYDQQQLVPPGMTLEDLDRTEYTTRSGRKTHRTPMKPEKS
ncbi:hypothetical protein BESB_085040 [Besnoitia besnoiti]|uniref:Uncharacterized protein n=1 Tax=Besnoitia besnoiti TaxID=94643 RepID=A0A2A9M5R9_BESBE|nr:hypothetical protein BESB_085040 [Besnoitia besnoiti]PFH33305.1 hypothetical protein BESB_085040 [Besnoitia besnoiti]